MNTIFRQAYKTVWVLFMGILITACDSKPEKKVYKSFLEMPTYKGYDLGLTYTPEASTFKIWSPRAEEIHLNIYEKGDSSESIEKIPLKESENGTWSTTIKGDYNGKYYTFQVKENGAWLEETAGIYAKAVGVNGNRAMVVDLKSTDPEGWENDKRPALASINDIILYEVHVRDYTISPNSGSNNPGKFIGLVENGTKSPKGVSTGIDHIRELGVTHVHLLPSFDYHTIDESNLDKPQFNWGYDPQNYNVPEGSYSTDPFNGEVRIKEFKQMVKGFHDNGIRVIMDVVYNHTFGLNEAPFNQEIEGYYYRQWEKGKYSDASACGNETASDHPMMRKYMVESLVYWAKEYHIDGFRFDLMGIHDIETMNQITKALKEIDPTIFVYGEGWTAGDSPLPVEKRALKAHTTEMEDVAAFSDDIRDAIKGHYAEETGKGFVSGKEGTAESVKFGVIASTQHPQINYAQVDYSDKPWASKPSQTINYVSCHDNHTLYDKLVASCEGESTAEIKKLHKLANAIVLTSQGIPFLHAGVEMMRTKKGEHNSYNLPDEINQIDWDWKIKNKDILAYYQGLIAVRKAHPAFRMPTAEMIQKHLQFMEFKNPLTIGYIIKDNANNDSAKRILVVYNGNKGAHNMNVPKGKWKILVDEKKADPKGIGTSKGGNLSVAGRSALVMIEE